MQENTEREIIGQEKQILFYQEEYINSKIIYEDSNEELVWKIGKTTIIGILIVMALIAINFWGGISVLMLLPLFLVVGIVGFPFSMSFGTSKLARTIFRPLFWNSFRKLEQAEKNMVVAKELLINELFSEQTKLFISELYVFLDKRLKNGKNVLNEDGLPGNTFILFGLIKRLKSLYEKSEYKNSNGLFEKIMGYMKDIRGCIVKLSKEIEEDNKNDILIKEFLLSHLNSSLEEEILKNDGILFNKPKYII